MATVIAAIDDSVAARPVISAALALARLLGADVQAIHVQEIDGQTARESAESLGVPFRQLRGEPLTEILVQAEAPDVIAVAIGARRPANDRGIGHMASAVADRTNKPVLVVPPESPPKERFGTALVAMEGTRERSRSVKAVLQVVASSDLDLVVVHVDDESSIPAFSDQVAHETDAYAKEFLARCLPGAPAARVELRVGSPAEEIVAAISALDADLVALGWPQGDPARGRNARGILDRSRVPVLLVALDNSAIPGVPDRSMSM
jgi:nucleotide-binding universal stress UspA family protein